MICLISARINPSVAPQPRHLGRVEGEGDEIQTKINVKGTTRKEDSGLVL